MRKSAHLAFACLLTTASSTFAQGIIVNEISQGPTGSQEFIELLVVGSAAQTTGTVDLRNWIIDDNNGSFALSDNSTPGIAIGHFRFAPSDTLQAVPIGALIVLYNVADKNPNWTFIQTDVNNIDIAHIENNGMTYYIPGTSTLLRACSGVPNNTSTSYAYTNSTIPPLAANWNGEIGLANNGDAIQTRNPAGTFYHGFGFSTPSQANAFTTFPLQPDVNLPSFNAFTGSAAGKVTYLDCGSWFYASNFLTGNATTAQAATSETPGLPNTANNDSLIAHIRSGHFNYSLLNQNALCALILPVNLLSFTAKPAGSTVLLQWETATEVNNQYFDVERSRDQQQWTAITRVAGAGNSNGPRKYQVSDNAPADGASFYRLKQADRDGTLHYSSITPVWMDLQHNGIVSVYPNPATDHLQVLSSKTADYILYNGLGVKMLVGRLNARQQAIDINGLASGWYLLIIRDDQGLQQQVKVFKK